MDLRETIRSRASALHEEIRSIRQHLHMHPELSFQEEKTSAFIREELEKIGITDIEKKAGTGWVALIKGKNATKKIVALRADIDALPIHEKNDVPYKSGKEGVWIAWGPSCITP